jgi:uncharacterized DUF497 family protein
MSISVLQNCTGFDWDKHNTNKNWLKHQALPIECEQIFFNKPLLVIDDIKHSQDETRCYALENTDKARKLFVVFTIRNRLIRIISAWDMSKKEREYYAKQ